MTLFAQGDAAASPAPFPHESNAQSRHTRATRLRRAWQAVEQFTKRILPSQMKPIRVLHVIGRMDRAGAETMLMNLYRAIDRNRYQFDFVYFTSDPCDFDEEIESLGGRIIRVTGGGALTRFFGLWRQLRRGEWRIVHSHTLFSTALHLLAAKLAGVPVRIAHSHNTNDASGRTTAGAVYHLFARRLLKRVPTDYVACGHAAAKFLFPGRSDVTIMPNAIDVGAFLDVPASVVRRELNIGPNCLVVIQVGRLMPVKNHALSLSIAECFRDRGRDFQMFFVGNGPLHKEIEGEIRKRKLERHVRLLGVREDIAALMRVADVMLMPSLHEGFPVVLVESQASGLPAVVSNAVSPEVDLGLGIVDFVDLRNSSELWADRIISAASTVLPDPEIRYQTLEENGFSVQAGARRLASIYFGS
jgi:glycosyltransferase EpsF